MEFPALAEDILTPSLPLGDMIATLAIAALLGGLIGLEREWRQKDAGLRTHMAVTLAAAAFALITRDYALDDTTGSFRGGDPFQLIRAVAEAAAVLAAGCIIASGGRIRGLTTGVGLWLSAAIGLACGIGSYVLAIVITVMTVIILGVLGAIERTVQRTGRNDDGEREDDAS